MRGLHQLLGDPSVAPEVGKYWLLLTQRQEVPCLELVSPRPLPPHQGVKTSLAINGLFIYSLVVPVRSAFLGLIFASTHIHTALSQFTVTEHEYLAFTAERSWPVCTSCLLMGSHLLTSCFGKISQGSEGQKEGTFL